MAEKTEKIVLAEESASEEEEEYGDFDITSLMDTQFVPETQFYDDPPDMKKPLRLSLPSPTKTSFPEPSTPDIIDELMAGPKSIPSVRVPPSFDVIEELMSIPVRTSTARTTKHCKTCTCFMNEEH